MSFDKAKIQRLLAAGGDPSQVASLIGCTPSYISQLMEDDGFSATVLAERYKRAADYQEHDDALDRLEMTIVKNLESSMGFCFKPEVLLKALTAVNSAKRRSTSQLSNPAGTTGTVINITLPPIMVNALRMNSNNEVVQVGERELVTLDNTAFNRLAGEHKTAAQRLGERHGSGELATAEAESGGDLGLQHLKAS